MHIFAGVFQVRYAEAIYISVLQYLIETYLYLLQVYFLYQEKGEWVKQFSFLYE